MKEKRITKFFLTCATLVTGITLGVNLCFQHSTKAVVAESSETSDTATADFIASIGETFLWKTFLHDSIVKYVLSKDVCYIEVFFLAHLSTQFFGTA